MKRFKKIIRFIILILLIVLAAVGVAAPISFNTREKYMDNEVRTEQPKKKEDESETDLKEVRE